ncbi:alpha/beta-hydrolase [Hypoxylon sp. NC1633]|nr:alpha/beta-hydrolase [Hypoxylon sp. NC1633]
MANEVCAQIPPVSSDYTPTGTYETIAGLKTYVVGPPSPSRAIIDIYDVFGPAPQTLQGADRLAAALSALVLVPDFLQGEYVQPEWMPPDTEAKKAALAQFRAGPGAVPPAVAKLLEVRREAGQRWPGAADRWGVFGLCWGGKVGVVACNAEDGEGLFRASGTAHPGGLAVEDAEALTVPHVLLASPGEPADVVAQYKEILARPGKTGVVETYDKMFHGWMGARANLRDELNRSEYERGYKQIADFYAQYL